MKKIGFIGTGIMGRPMVENLLKAGFSLTVYNRTKSKTEPLRQKGATVVDEPGGVAEDTEVIIIMLSDHEAIDSVIYHEDGLLKRDISGKVIINMSTVSPEYNKKLQKMFTDKGATFIDAPVSGSKKPAEEGTLVILASGPEQMVRELEAVFLSMGKKVVYCGDVPMGSKMKLAINLLLGSMMEALSESLNFAERSGISRELFLNTVLSGPLGCGLFQVKKDMLLKDDYPVQFPLKHMLKDLRFVIQEADSVGAAVPAGHSVFQLYRQALGKGLADEDFAAVKKVLSMLSDSSE